jgi:hypothetical protein
MRKVLAAHIRIYIDNRGTLLPSACISVLFMPLSFLHLCYSFSCLSHVIIFYFITPVIILLESIEDETPHYAVVSTRPLHLPHSSPRRHVLSDHVSHPYQTTGTLSLHFYIF